MESESVVLGVLRLAADSVAHLPVLICPVVVPGPHSKTGYRGTSTKIKLNSFGKTKRIKYLVVLGMCLKKILAIPWL